jgi:hypothetical protein
MLRVFMALRIHLQISEASCASRADDTSKLKNAILDYIYEDPKKGSSFPPALQNEKLVSAAPKSLRGFRNIETTYHLCPLKFKSTFEENPQYVKVHRCVFFQR